MKNCEECGQPYKTLYRVKYELFHLRWIHICFNCGKLNRMLHGDALIYGGNANYPVGFFNVKKRIFRPKEDPSKSYHLLFKIKEHSLDTINSQV